MSEGPLWGGDKGEAGLDRHAAALSEQALDR